MGFFSKLFGGASGAPTGFPRYVVILTDLTEAEINPLWPKMIITQALIIHSSETGQDLPDGVELMKSVGQRLGAPDGITCRVATETPKQALSDTTFHERVFGSLHPEYNPRRHTVVTVDQDSGGSYGMRPIKVLMAFEK